jgi:DNA polymerase III epsilon subunit family exonuclease
MHSPTAIIPHGEFVIVDIETTGFSCEKCSILQISALKVRGGEIVEEYSTYILQDQPIPYFITKLTGITDRHVRKGIPMAQALEGYLRFLGDLPMVGHNVSFDYGFLQHYARQTLGRSIPNVLIDTVRLAKGKVRQVENYKLGTLADYFHIAREGQHMADVDTRITYELIKALSRDEDC